MTNDGPTLAERKVARFNAVFESLPHRENIPDGVGLAMWNDYITRLDAGECVVIISRCSPEFSAKLIACKTRRKSKT